MENNEPKPAIPVSKEVEEALMKRDISDIKKSVTGIEDGFKQLDVKFARKEDLKEIERMFNKHTEENKREMDKKADHADIANLQEAVKLKVEKTEFEPIKTTLARINWMVIAAVIVGLLALIIRASP